MKANIYHEIWRQLGRQIQRIQEKLSKDESHLDHADIKC